ncbi:hypothetical protein ILUMI_14804 [Ignelater luminosus]|uniref:Uncharacterized protein n=1 Tax=Ignelater luminosus TaxID=2038154 RepID=A0A8K0CPT7_IGNLU|nr:hypothetical protein ILUMI_14804 [Ignelater luminosus]
MDETWKAREIYEAKIPRKNIRGRPRKKWEEQVREAVERRAIKWNESEKLAQDRKFRKEKIRTKPYLQIPNRAFQIMSILKFTVERSAFFSHILNYNHKPFNQHKVVTVCFLKLEKANLKLKERNVLLDEIKGRGMSKTIVSPYKHEGCRIMDQKEIKRG